MVLLLSLFVCRSVSVRYHATKKQQLYIRFYTEFVVVFVFSLDVFVDFPTKKEFGALTR